MHPVRRFHLLLLAAALAAIPGCDIIGGHGNVDVINNTGKYLARVQLVFTGGDEEGGALAQGGTVHFTTISAGAVTANGYDSTSMAAVGSASGTLEADATIQLTLVGH